MAGFLCPNCGREFSDEETREALRQHKELELKKKFLKETEWGRKGGRVFIMGILMFLGLFGVVFFAIITIESTILVSDRLLMPKVISAFAILAGFVAVIAAGLVFAKEFDCREDTAFKEWLKTNNPNSGF